MDASRPNVVHRNWICLVGDHAVGKSCLRHRFVHGEYDEPLVSFFDFKDKKIDVEGNPVEFRVMKMNAVERAGNVRRSFYRSLPAEGFIIIYDITNQESFYNVTMWVQEINNHAPKNTSKILVGTRCDLAEKRKVPFAVAKELADQLGLPLFEASSKDGTNVNEAFMAVCTDILRRRSTDNGNVKLDPKDESRSQGCNI